MSISPVLKNRGPCDAKTPRNLSMISAGCVSTQTRERLCRPGRSMRLHITRLWPFWSRQEGRMCLMIDELSHSSCYRRRTSHATPARGNHTGMSAFRATLFGPRLAPCPGLAPGSDARSRGPHGDSGPAGDGAGHGAPLHPRPSRPQPGDLVSTAGESDAVRVAHHAVRARGSDDRARSG